MDILNIKDYIRNLDTVVGCTVGCNYCFARINNKRFPVTEDFAVPELVEKRLKRISTKTPNTYLMTSSSDFSDWKEEWRSRVFHCMEQNPQHNYLFLTKRPERVRFSTTMDNVWIGVTVTTEKDKERIAWLKKNIGALHYFITFEPLHRDVSKMDLEGVGWIVIGTETGSRKGKVTTRAEWIENIVIQASALDIPVFMKATLADIVGPGHMLQNFPSDFLKLDKTKGENRNG